MYFGFDEKVILIQQFLIFQGFRWEDVYFNVINAKNLVVGFL